MFIRSKNNEDMKKLLKKQKHCASNTVQYLYGTEIQNGNQTINLILNKVKFENCMLYNYMIW